MHLSTRLPIAAVALLTFVSSADASVFVNLRAPLGHVKFGLPAPRDGCAGVAPTTIVISGEGATTQNSTAQRCDRFPNDAFDRGHGWTQHGSRGRSVFVPHVDVGFYDFRFELVRDGRVRAHGSIHIHATHRRERVYDDERGFERYCIADGIRIREENGQRFCVRRGGIDYRLRTLVRY